MKNKTLLLVNLCSIFSFSTLISQDAVELFKKAKDKCLSIDEGYYELTEKWKPLSESDTSSYLYHIYFSKAETDDVFGMHFKSTYFWKDTVKSHSIYDGHHLVDARQSTKEATVYPVSSQKEHLLQVKHNFRFYNIISPVDENALPELEDIVLSYQGLKKLEGKDMHHIKAVYKPDEEESGDITVLYRESNFLIGTEDNVPYRYTERVDVIMTGDTMIQFKEYTIRNTDFDNKPDQSMYAITSLPADYILKEFTPSVRVPLLENTSMAPEWSFESLDGEMIALSDLKGKLVLIDFFYKACFPCMQALPALQSLNEKFKDQGLVVIGMDPYDDKEDNLKEFLTKRKVTYNVLYADKKIAANYNVTGYPTMYLVDANGVIIYGQAGYGEGTEDKLEKIITEHLGKK